MKKLSTIILIFLFTFSLFSVNILQNRNISGRWMASFNTGQGFQVYYLIFNENGTVTYTSRVYSRSRSNHYEQIVATGKYKLDGLILNIQKKFINEPDKIHDDSYTIVEINENNLKFKTKTGFVFNYKKVKTY